MLNILMMCSQALWLNQQQNFNQFWHTAALHQPSWYGPQCEQEWCGGGPDLKSNHAEDYQDFEVCQAVESTITAKDDQHPKQSQAEEIGAVPINTVNDEGPDLYLKSVNAQDFQNPELCQAEEKRDRQRTCRNTQKQEKENR